MPGPCRDTLREVGPDQPGELSEAFAEATDDVVEPWWKSTLSFDRHRLAEMAAIAEGGTYRPDDPAFEIGKALGVAAGKDPDVLRASVDIAFVLDLPEVVLARPGIMDKVIELGADWRDGPSDRAQSRRAGRDGDGLNRKEGESCARTTMGSGSTTR